jgi:DNA-binding CsgD family transcriptional regulator
MFSSVSPQSFDALAFANAVAKQRSGFGILVFTFGSQLLYMNQESKELMWRVNQAVSGRTANGVVPAEVLDLCHEILGILKIQSHPKDGEQIQLRRVIGTASCAVLVQGVAVPHATTFQNGRIVFIMCEVSERKEASAKLAKDQFNLTEREQTVVLYLLEGLTNKEIGEKLGIAEPTVKGHIRHIMQKTNTSTRTAVLAKVLASTDSLRELRRATDTL